LEALPRNYEQWISRFDAKVSDPRERLGDHRPPAKRAEDRCRSVLKRIEAGIELLAGNQKAFDAFRFANRAMYLQRIHSLIAENRRRGKQVSKSEIASRPENYSWYPFQLAFILLNLPSCTDLHHPDRSHETDALADLLWFPTGGGKTEAYLGLSAYV